MATNIFSEGRKTIPKSDSRILAQPYDQQDMGARKAALPKLQKNSLVISHVGKK